MSFRDGIACRVRDGSLVPAGSAAKGRLADMGLREGQTVLVEVTDGWSRSRRTHAHQFAWLADAHANIPEQYAAEAWAQTTETLRKHALIETGYCRTSEFLCATADDALTALRAVYQDAIRAHGYAQVSVAGQSVTIRTPLSQSNKAMDAKHFQESKSAVLDWCAAMIGVDAATLAREGGMAA